MSQGFICEDQKDLTIPEDKIVPARLSDLKVDSYEYDGKKIDKLLWYFEILDDEYKDNDGNRRIVRGQTGFKLTTHPNNRFRAWAESLLQRDIPVKMRITREDLVGMHCKITVRHEKDRKNEGVVWDRIDEVLPAGTDVYDQPPF